MNDFDVRVDGVGFYLFLEVMKGYVFGFESQVWFFGCLLYEIIVFEFVY